MRWTRIVAAPAAAIVAAGLAWATIAYAGPVNGHARTYYSTPQKTTEVGYRNLLRCIPDYGDPNWGVTSAHFTDHWYPCGDP
jgi:hypothetical protein